MTKQHDTCTTPSIVRETARFLSLNDELSPSNDVAQSWQKIRAPFFVENNLIYTAEREAVPHHNPKQEITVSLHNNTYSVSTSSVQLPFSGQAHAIDITCTTPSILWAHISQSFTLSESEMRVMYWTAIGCKAADIAEKTGYTTSTVHTYQKHLYSKLGLTRQNQLTAFLWLHS